MNNVLNGKIIFAHSAKVVARKIEGRFIIVPIADGVGDLDNELFSLSKTGKIIWDRIDGKKPLIEIAREIGILYPRTDKKILAKDISSFLLELHRKNLVLMMK